MICFQEEPPEFPFDTLIVALREAMMNTIERWNLNKPEQFLNYFEIDYQGYMARFPEVGEQTAERTKIVSPALMTMLNNSAIEIMGDCFEIVQGVGSDVRVTLEGITEDFEQKLTTSANNAQAWTGNHVSNQDCWHILIRTRHHDDGRISSIYFGLLDYQSCTGTEWRRTNGNRATLIIHQDDRPNLYSIIGGLVDRPLTIAGEPNRNYTRISFYYEEI